MSNNIYRIDTLTISHCAVAYAALVTGRSMIRDAGQLQATLLDILTRGESALGDHGYITEMVEGVLHQDATAPMCRGYSAAQVFAAAPPPDLEALLAEQEQGR